MNSKVFANFLCFAAGLIVMLLFCAWRIGNIPAVLEKKQNDAKIASCEQNLIRSEHCILIAIPESNLK